MLRYAHIFSNILRMRSSSATKFKKLLLNTYFISSRNIYILTFHALNLIFHVHRKLDKVVVFQNIIAITYAPMHWKSFGNFVTLPYVSYYSRNSILTQTGSRTWRTIFIFDILFLHGHDTRVLDTRRILSSLQHFIHYIITEKSLLVHKNSAKKNQKKRKYCSEIERKICNFNC